MKNVRPCISLGAFMRLCLRGSAPLLVWLAMGICCGPLRAANVATRDLLAQGGEDHFWIARVVSSSPSSPYETTELLYREDFGGPWTQLRTVASRVVSLASDQSELLLALDDGQWMIADDNDIRLGPPPPGDGKIIAIANEQKSIWAVVTDDGPPTPPSTAPTERWLVYPFVAGAWVQPQKLPDIGASELQSLSLAVVNQLPMIAWRQDNGAIQISGLTAAGKWSDPVTLRPPPGSADFKLLSAQGNAVLWTSSPPGSPDESFGGELHEGDDFSKTVALALPGSAPPAGGTQTLAFFKERWRWLSVTGMDFYERDFEQDGRPAPMEMPGEAPSEPIVPLDPYLGGAGLVVVIAAAAAIAQRRGQKALPTISASEVMDRIAPLGVRSAAAMVDLVPALATLGAIPRSAIPPSTAADATTIAAILLIGLATYILHPLVAELICGQSVGKMMFGLRVVGSFGGKPTVLGIIARNFIRVLDLCPAISFIAVIISPRWQRIGDLVGRTVVITDDPRDSGRDDD